MSFERVPDLNNEVVWDLDLDMDGISVAVTQPSANTSKVWINEGSGWRVLLTPPSFAATSACTEPGGSTIFVGLHGAHFLITNPSGEILHGPARYNVSGEGNEVDTWSTRQCRWIPERGGTVFVTLSSDDRTGGALLYLDVSRITSSASWTRLNPPIQTPTGAPQEYDLAFDGLSVSIQSGVGVGVGAGVAYGFSPSALTQRYISGNPYGDPDDSWIILDAYQGTAQYGAPRDFGSFPQRGSADLYREISGGQWRVIVSAPQGYRGIAILEAPELRGTALALDVAQDGHLWIGGEGGLGLWRSTEPVR